ncbi:helix-turn-helix domain-containing protein [Lentzea tibetensis]|uniref:Helix-turn-helix domain-containing protein n=1 Tax=Lentzea tibetensis TaxID=2591470 RepID=A0A563EVE0_9PSEU|nr:helix-turn-helix domain-containing protein [Lentzea tibetensis]
MAKQVSMDRPTSDSVLHRPRDVAKRLGCSEWWIKEQARNRRIPFSWIGGRYLFTDEHVSEIVAIFERRPVELVVPAAHHDQLAQAREVRVTNPTTRLKARAPKRARNARAQSTAA